jgi:hypothetical protein
MAGVRPLDQLGTSPYWTLTKPCFAASLPALGSRAVESERGTIACSVFLINPAAATTPPRRGRIQHNGDLRTATFHRARLYR